MQELVLDELVQYVSGLDELIQFVSGAKCFWEDKLTVFTSRHIAYYMFVYAFDTLIHDI